MEFRCAPTLSEAIYRRGLSTRCCCHAALKSVLAHFRCKLIIVMGSSKAGHELSGVGSLLDRTFVS
jgi:hypothetical protein